uniref:Cilia and flagella associated protein 100 n=1 Tax=Leptobrachium leishanense TaxID=445787 RepID=A0A8C5Q1S6_9ANUR
MSSISLERSTSTRGTAASAPASRLSHSASHLSVQRSNVNSAKSGSDAKSTASGRIKKKSDTEQNPFRIPSNVDFFLIRDQEKETKQKEKERNKNLRVHQKTTYTTKMNTKLAGLRRETEREQRDGEAEESEKSPADAIATTRENPSWKLAITRDKPVQKESLHDFINKKREMFLLEYSLTVKRDEIQKLEALAAAEEMKLEKAEQFLQEDAKRFDEFLKQNDMNSVNALEQAERESNLKKERVAQIKSQTTQMINIRSDISKCEEVLREFLTYRDFLFKLSPPEWQEDVLKRKKPAPVTVHETRSAESKISLSPVPAKKSESRSSGQAAIQSRDSMRDTRQASRHSTKTVTSKKLSNAALPVEEKDGAESLVISDSEEEPELYFKDPQQLLKIFSELEEQNLSLIQNSQETEESLEEIKQNITSTEEKMERETQQLKDHIEQLTTTIAQEAERAADLELKSRVFSFGQYKSEDQENMLSSLSRKVEEIYQACIGENRANLNALQMLMIIEHQLEELLDHIEVIPRERIEVAEKAKEKERRLRLREEKIKQQKLHQEERLRKALERAQADPKKNSGRKLMMRSDPPTLKLKLDKDQDVIDKEKEEAQLFFS